MYSPPKPPADCGATLLSITWTWRALNQHPDPLPHAVIAQNLQIEQAVVGTQEDVLAVVAPLCDVMRAPGNYHACHTGHHANSAGRPRRLLTEFRDFVASLENARASC